MEGFSREPMKRCVVHSRMPWIGLLPPTATGRVRTYPDVYYRLYSACIVTLSRQSL